eukprot:g1615.t1
MFLTPGLVRRLGKKYKTPVYVYDAAQIMKNVKEARSMPNPYGVTVRYAMKALPHAAILQLLQSCGIRHIDASSTFEVLRALRAGFEPENISLSAQMLDERFEGLVRKGVRVNCCSLTQLTRYGRLFPGTQVGIRFNVGIGSGHSPATNVGGPTSSFGIWHEHMDSVKKVVRRYNLFVVRIHTHIGSGTDPHTWRRASDLSLALCKEFDSVATLNLGGGFKVKRVRTERSTDLKAVGQHLRESFREFHESGGRKLHLEIEPGTGLVANAGAIVFG